MCMGNVADMTMSGLGTMLDPTGKIGIRDKAKGYGQNAREALSMSPTVSSPSPVQGPQQVQEISAQQRRSLIN